MGDPFLNYFALFLLIFVVVVLFYGIIAIHDIPAMIAESRDHPHQDAIHAAGWVSLFTLHALWPFLWIWAMAYRPDAVGGSRSSSLRRSTQRQGLTPASWRICTAALRPSRAARGRESDNGTPAHPDLRLNLLRGVQVFQDTG
jgi:Protein of unknown function (DUF3302)